MKRVCMDCRADLGEKCPECGGTAIRYVERDIENCQCVECEHIFTEGDGGETTGICERCLAERRKQINVGVQA